MSAVLSALPNGSFGDALAALKQGKCVTRKPWFTKEKGKWIAFQNPADAASIITVPYIYEKTDTVIRVWEPRQVDILSNDWILIRHPFAPDAKKVS